MNAPKDSTPDTMAHIAKVRNYLYQTSDNLVDRGQVHDQSKLESVEKPGFDRVVGALEGLTYPSDEYRDALKAADLKPTLEHHYANNRHHPEHYPNGINDMTWPDIEEMMCDWKAASERMLNGGDFAASMVHNRQRFEIDNQLFGIMVNSCKERGWIAKDWEIPDLWQEGLDLIAAVYTERARLIALVASIFPAWTAPGPVVEPGYSNIVYIELPTGQCSWHIADVDWHFFEGAQWMTTEHPMAWDGHSTELKHYRIEEAITGLNRMEYGFEFQPGVITVPVNAGTATFIHRIGDTVSGSVAGEHPGAHDGQHRGGDDVQGDGAAGPGASDVNLAGSEGGSAPVQPVQPEGSAES